MIVRSSGVLLHVTSLPSSWGVGDLGAEARRFAELLAGAGQSYWQMLPVGPTSAVAGSSPYSCFSAFAGNTLLVSPDWLVDKGFAEPEDVSMVREAAQGADPRHVDFSAVEAAKARMLRRVFERNAGRIDRDELFQAFCGEHDWLHDYARFVVLKERCEGRPWTEWPEPLRDRHEDALRHADNEHAARILAVKYGQYLFFRQWAGLRRHCNDHGVRLIGDIPIYVTLDSADVWSHQHLYKLGPDRMPTHVAGVPPDYFSETGQRWGNPVYDWSACERDGFAWWLMRMGHNFRLFDCVRLDHFRGFAAYWEIPANEETAIHGEWVPAPGHALFRAMSRRFAALPIIAEDLGVITPDVRELQHAFRLPGMKVLQFGFNGDLGSNPDCPHNHMVGSVVYPGTHDNNTARGWWLEDATEEEKWRLADYVGRFPEPHDVHEAFIRLAMSSVAQRAVVAMQDILGLGAEARMNTPGLAQGNWSWRMLSEEMDPGRMDFLSRIAGLCGRT